jgi:hypothetical protein
MSSRFVISTKLHFSLKLRELPTPLHADISQLRRHAVPSCLVRPDNAHNEKKNYLLTFLFFF